MSEPQISVPISRVKLRGGYLTSKWKTKTKTKKQKQTKTTTKTKTNKQTKKAGEVRVGAQTTEDLWISIGTSRVCSGPHVLIILPPPKKQI